MFYNCKTTLQLQINLMKLNGVTTDSSKRLLAMLEAELAKLNS
jgi:hypothetical protein